MASTSAAAADHHIIDDDDGFDWDAAVREIDIACAQKSESNPRVSCVPGKASSFASSSRQTTLDRFITGPTRQNEGNNFCNNVNYVCNSFNNVEDEFREAEGNACFTNIDFEAAKTWVYPVNIPRRKYQFNITRTALFSNTLVALPTGLGKTLIAAVVMFNYFRWFPEGKIVFAAPSRPLVLQQIEACHSIVGIPQEWTIDLTGQTNPTKRAHYWNTKRVFFVTPQVLEKDIHSGSCVMKDLVCLVIDEAHRAMGNYSYCVVARELLAVAVELRILALTATPGSKQQTVQHIIDNLQISRLEYRSESDPDVIPYVHDKKLELIEVALGNDAVEVNTLILDVIRPYIARLGSIGVLPSRDIQTFSPCDLLNSRDKFRQAPPGNLPQTKYGEIEGYFGALITLYHIRKLLSSHGIKPAFEMLQEKFQQGSFARLMSRNETLLKAKLVMQKNISHGAPSPKLSKLLEVLSDHFRTKDPQNSRVIIFSNFRGSVRDIMVALKEIEAVKATEFIGQSSGKASKGQTQKVQQAVLQKFRAGGYNVIVATSIGEEGLDIMEVDLVICFDANISPLRMIQRMGRTGRKNEGRVVVLACEGSELKGYTRKLANSKAIKKHMQNGGTNSFQFHPSPRMIPHILKPEVQFVELSIEQFVPRTKKVDEDSLIASPAFTAKLTDAESDLVAKYFSHSEEITWRPSLIAFPHFQAFPSRVGEVVHSCRTGMLIDAMQNLQGLSFPEHAKPFPIEDRASPETCLNSDADEQYNHIMTGNVRRDSLTEPRSPMIYPEEDPGEILGSIANPGEKINANGDPFSQDPQEKNSTHSFLFNSKFIALDDSGRVMVLSLPEFPLKRGPMSQSVDVNVTVLPYHKEACVEFSTNICKENEQVKDAPASQMRSHEECKINHVLNASKDQTLVMPNLPVLRQRLDGGESICSSPQDRTPILFDDEGNEDSRDSDLSPRLTNFIECGIVPESPITLSERPCFKEDGLKVPDLVSTPMHSKLVVKSIKQIEEGAEDICGPEMNGQSSFINEIRTPVANRNKTGRHTCPTGEEARSPFITTPDSGCSKDWHLNSGDKPESLQQKNKLKRLRKLGDRDRNKPEVMKNQVDGPSRNTSSLCVTADYARNLRGRGKKQTVHDAKVFIEEEAEVSSDAGVSADEEDNLDNSYEDSFIDDRLNPTAISTQAEDGAVDMMAVYRRSLLSQSPLQIMRSNGGDVTPSSGVPRNESASTSGSESHSAGKNAIGLDSTARNAPSSRLNCILDFSDPIQSSRTGLPEEYGSKIENHKRRRLYQPGSLPIQNLEQEFLVQSVASRKDSVQEDAKLPENEDIYDDQFFNDIDLDAVEEEATRLLRYRIESSKQKPEPMPPNPAVLAAPSFDLGIDFEEFREPF